MKESMMLSKETVKRIKEEAKAFSAKYDGIDKFGDLEHGYIVGAQNEAQRAMIVEAEKDKELYEERKRLEGYIQDKDNKIGQLTSERDAYKQEVEKLKSSLHASERFRIEDAGDHMDGQYISAQALNQAKRERDAYKEALEKAKAIADKYFAMNPRVVKKEDEVYKIFTEVLNQFNNTENKSHE